ncbi:hypothetical protein H2200_003531 [Cladophialophora chaetospira]|uniref:Peptidase S8/S53 domain-containing protein n=1 Tax=Cladophialophora chaetospira TaxID=386627 RepID=A0AA38XHM6_9EURO|nr:hypothetical protein H2200_003531 [Cladophialophora chaetospira]
MAIIHINGNEFDPTSQSDIFRRLSIEDDDASNSNYILVQTLENLSNEQQIDLESHGAEVLEYVSPYTYLCRYFPADLTGVRELYFVTWTASSASRRLLPKQRIVTEQQLWEHGIAPSETTEAQRALRSVTIHHTNPYTQCENLANRTFAPCLNTVTKREIDIVLHRGLEVNDDIVRWVADLAEVDTDLITQAASKLRVHMGERYLDQVAKLDEVYFVEEVLPICLHDDRARAILGANDVAIQGSPVFRGRGQVVAVADTGLDLGVHSNIHPAIGGKVRALFPFGRNGQANDPDGHGTHVCGSVVADGFCHTPQGLQRVQGTAPEASLVVQSLFEKIGPFGQARLKMHPNLVDLFRQAYDTGARIHNNSWGTTMSRKSSGYVQSSREIDEFAYEYPDMVILFAAGNACVKDSPYGQIRSQGFAKNCITVGASENLRPELNVRWEDVTDGFPSPPECDDFVADQADGMAPTSSRGDKLIEGMSVRMKPDLVAPGSSILSARSSNIDPRSFIAQCPDAWGVCQDPNWLYLGGSSMATALVSGCCAILRENLIHEGVTSPSSALIKALLINGAIDLPGQYPSSEAGKSPNPNSGWGRVNLQNSLISQYSQYTGYFEDEVGTVRSTFQSTIHIGQPPRTPYTFTATLVWTDPPSQPSQNGYQVLQNSLGLASRVNQREKHANREEDDLSFDLSNNVQQIIWDDLSGSQAIIIEVLALHLTLGKPQAFSVAWRIY